MTKRYPIEQLWGEAKDVPLYLSYQQDVHHPSRSRFVWVYRQEGATLFTKKLAKDIQIRLKYTKVIPYSEE